MTPSAPVLYVLAGPNGAGKTTFYDRVVGPATSLPFVEAVLIAAERWPDDPLVHGYEAARIAAEVRARLLDSRASFVTETVFSHRSKVDLVQRAAEAGYLVHLHVLMVPADLSVARVAQRIAEGGHDVPADKIRQRHHRLWELVTAAIDVTYETAVWDSTGPGFVRVATFRYGRPTVVADLPECTPSAIRAKTGQEDDDTQHPRGPSRHA